MLGCLTDRDFESYDEGNLSDEEIRRFREHLDSCARCQSSYLSHRGARDPHGQGHDPEVTETLSVTPKAVGGHAPSEAPRQVPRIEGYHITGVLGQGGMGIVYRAVQTKLNRVVALKVLPALVGSASPAAVTRFRREATAAARLHHTNITPIYDFGESPDAYYYAMELIDGQPLNTLIRQFRQEEITTLSPTHLAELLQRSLGVALAVHEAEPASGPPSHSGMGSSSTGRGRAYYQQVARWMADAADALHYAHGQDIIHRDVKPANLILSTDGRIMITDFGLAKTSGEASVTITGSLLGTVRYLSPEQAMAKRIPVDHRTDIYSLGATMYELLCFNPAFPGTDEKQVLAAIITREPTPPRKVTHAVPQELETICLKTLEKSPDARYSTARALSEDLRRYLNDLPIIAKPPGLARRSVKFVKRHKAPVVAVVAAVFVAIATTGYVVSNTRRIAAEVESHLAEGDRLMEAARGPRAAAKWSLAAREYEQALELDPDNVTALGNMAIFLKERYNSLPDPNPTLLEEAVGYCSQALEIDERRSRLWNTLGVLLKKQGKYDEAADAYQHEIDLSPASPYALANRAAVNALRHDLDGAERDLERAVALAERMDSPFCGVLRDLAELQLFLQKSTAFEYIEKASECAPDDPFTCLVEAKLLLTLDGYVDQEEALTVARTADRIAKGRNPAIKRVLALALLRNGKLEEAMAEAQVALDLGGQLCANRLIIGLAQGQMGGFVAARATLDQAVRAWPADLREPGSFVATAEKGVLWIESADVLMALRKELDDLLALQPP